MLYCIGLIIEKYGNYEWNYPSLKWPSLESRALQYIEMCQGLGKDL